MCTCLLQLTVVDGRKRTQTHRVLRSRCIGSAAIVSVLQRFIHRHSGPVCLSVCLYVCLCVCMCALQMPTTLLIESRRAFLPGQLATLHFSLNFHSLQLEHG